MKRLNIILARGLSMDTHMRTALAVAALDAGRELIFHTSEFTPPSDEDTIRLMEPPKSMSECLTECAERFAEEAAQMRANFEDAQKMAELRGRETAYERRNCNQPFYANIKRSRRRHHK